VSDEVKHTPGPWRVNHRCVEDEARNAIASVYRNVDGTGHNKANARLIAAAPDLLAACEAILSGWGHQDGVSRAVEKARAARAKARGE